MIFMDPSQDVTIRLNTFTNKWATFLEVMTAKLQNNGMLGKDRGKKGKRKEERGERVETPSSGQNQR